MDHSDAFSMLLIFIDNFDFERAGLGYFVRSISTPLSSGPHDVVFEAIP